MVLDVVYHEDYNCIRYGNAAEYIAIFRRLCMNLARIRPKMIQCGENQSLLDGMMTFVQNYFLESRTKVRGCPG